MNDCKRFFFCIQFFFLIFKYYVWVNENTKVMYKSSSNNEMDMHWVIKQIFIMLNGWKVDVCVCVQWALSPWHPWEFGMMLWAVEGVR